MPPPRYPTSNKRKYYRLVGIDPSHEYMSNPHASSIKEIEYARSHLGAIGTVLLSNHEGYYLGDPLFTPFFRYLNSRRSQQEAIFIHPNVPVLRLNGSLVPANPSKSEQRREESPSHCSTVREE